MAEQAIPLRKRPLDLILFSFFLINLLFITYGVDLESLVVPDAYHFTYPLWPPRIAVDVIHFYGRTLDPDLMARPPWWKMTIWIEVIFFGPFYLAALYAFLKGRDWIRIPSIMYATSIITNVLIILSEEKYGDYPAPNFPVVLLINLPWVIFPGLLLVRMARDPHPFTAPQRSGNVIPIPTQQPTPLE